MDFTALVQSQHDYFRTGATRPAAFRETALRKLRDAVLRNQRELEAAMAQDFRKPAAEVYMTETGMVLAIEPMITAGSPAVKVLADGWTAVTRDGSRAAHWELVVAATAEGPRVMGGPASL